jgi:outer membrane protein
MRPIRLSAVAGALCLLAIGPWPAAASAQGLRELYESARSYDAGYLAALAQSEAAQYRVQQAEALKHPNAALTVDGTVGRLDPENLPSGEANSLRTALSGRWPLLNRASDATISQARKALISSQAALDAAEQDLIVRLAQAYFDVLAAQDSLDTNHASKTATAEQLASAKRNFEVGTATITDTREAQARYDLVLAQEIAAENLLRTRRIALDQLVGRTGVTPLGLPVPFVIAPVQPADPEAWVGTADAQHPAIRQARNALEIAELETERARAAGSPTLDAVGSVGVNRNSGIYAGGFPGENRSASIGLQFAWPFYTGGLVDGRVKESVALENRARNDLAAAQRAVALGTRTAFYNVQSKAAEVRALEAAEASNKLALEATQLGYKVGVRVNLDVLNAQTQLFETQRALARARYDLLVGSLLLRQASGQLSATDVDTMSLLLRH